MEQAWVYHTVIYFAFMEIFLLLCFLREESALLVRPHRTKQELANVLCFCQLCLCVLGRLFDYKNSQSVEVLAPVYFLFLIAHVNTDTVVVQWVANLVNVAACWFTAICAD